MFKRFQRYVAEKIANEQIYKYRVHEFGKEKPEYVVTFVSSSTSTTCSCQMFDFVGILCRHQLTVLIKKKVHSLPRRYILSRWTRDAKKGAIDSHQDEQLEKNAPKSSMMLFNSIMELDALKLEDDKPDNTNVLTNNNDPGDDVSKDHGNHLNLSAPQNWNQGQGSMILETHLTDSTEIMGVIQELPETIQKD
ncbi:Zinc finger, PMZ-type [Corchorus olitorius]|uniref:Protein FAR1-RELATED SEQUENCE n=1 Tax=Corchorus olitorius TaxID=93759 RepID=A0A1R3JH43_9ROSI|nr:Zinc finger, PMZ-type [Corchorus olitorius]